MRSFKVDALEVRVFASGAELGVHAADLVGGILRERLAVAGGARMIVATGNSQGDFLEALVRQGGIDWGKVTVFHMDEYLGLGEQHGASFARFVRERVVERVGVGVFHALRGDAELPLVECARYGELLGEGGIDVCCLGIGENGHLAFNDPGVADFADGFVVKLVKLERECRLQQVGEGHFGCLAEVPEFAYTLSIPALCNVGRMVCIVPEGRKAEAVRRALEGPIEEGCPASVLRRMGHAVLLLDGESAGGVSKF